jgi:uncharacterized protein YdaU (DUF1376 family)
MKESNTSPWMAFWGEDFNRSTIGWSLEERGAYHFLLWHSWSCDGLPPELDRIFRLDSDLKRLWPCLESKFPIAKDGRRRNPRQERGRLEMINISSGKSKAGKLGATKRWQQDNGICHASAIPSAISLPMAEPMRSQWQTDGYSPSPSPLPSLSLSSPIPSAKKHTLNGVAVEPEFEKKKLAKSIPASEIERVWECFPRKVGKLKSLALIRKACDLVAIEHDLLDAGDAVEYMIEKVNLFADECRKKATEPQFIAHPQTWLNGGRYLDPVVTESN